MKLRPVLNLVSDRLHALPVVVLYITDKCNSRCIGCDYWRFGQNEISMELVEQLVRDLPRFGTRYLLLSGGEPLQHPNWESIATAFCASGIRVGMATSGILLAKHADAVATGIDEVYVSLDGATPETYRSIRGVDGFRSVLRGIERLAGRVPVTFRTTVQRGNYREIPALIRLTRSWGATHHSFLAVDVSSHAAFARMGEFDRTMALRAEDLDPFAQILDETAQEFAPDFKSGYLVESPARLRMLHGYFRALLGLGNFPPVRCNAPRFSAVIETDGSLKPCFFLPAAGRYAGKDIDGALNTPAAVTLRRQQRQGQRPECLRCVCPAYRSARDLLEGA